MKSQQNRIELVTEPADPLLQSVLMNLTMLELVRLCVNVNNKSDRLLQKDPTKEFLLKLTIYISFFKISFLCSFFTQQACFFWPFFRQLGINEMPSSKVLSLSFEYFLEFEGNCLRFDF